MNPTPNPSVTPGYFQFTFSDLGAPVVMMGHLTPVAESVRDRTETLYRADGARLWRAIVGYAGDRVVADDAVSEAFTQLLRRGLAVQDAQAGTVLLRRSRRTAGTPGARPRIEPDGSVDGGTTTGLQNGFGTCREVIPRM